MEDVKGFFEGVKAQFVSEAEAVGFTKEQAEFLYDKMKTSSLGMGLFF